MKANESGLFPPLQPPHPTLHPIPLPLPTILQQRSAIFMGSECVIEKMRGKTDMMNSVYAGCATGAAFGIRQGPQAACFGCVGMATFSAIMDKVMGH